jgi:exodeoxyribonuclease VII large subunit
MTHRLALHRSGLMGSRSRLASLSPLATLQRGYSVVRRADTGVVVRSVGQVSAGDLLAIQVRDGEFDAVTGPPAGTTPAPDD